MKSDYSGCNVFLIWADAVKDKQEGGLQGNPLSCGDHNWTGNTEFQKTCLRVFKLYNVKCETTGASRSLVDRDKCWRVFILFTGSSTATHSRQEVWLLQHSTRKQLIRVYLWRTLGSTKSRICISFLLEHFLMNYGHFSHHMSFTYSCAYFCKLSITIFF